MTNKTFNEFTVMHSYRRKPALLRGKPLCLWPYGVIAALMVGILILKLTGVIV